MIVWLYIDRDGDLMLTDNEPHFATKDGSTMWIGFPNFVLKLDSKLNDGEHFRLFSEMWGLKKSCSKVKVVLRKWPMEA